MVATLIPLSVALAADYDGYDHEREDRDPANSIHAGAHSIEFLTFGGGQSGVFGTWLLSNRIALRAGTIFVFNEQSGNTPSSGTFTRARTDRNHDFRVSVGLQDYVDARGPVTIFLAVASYYHRTSYFSEDSQYQLYNGVVYADSSHYDDREWAIGGETSAGFEWFFRRKLSVEGRVAASLEFGKDRNVQFARASDSNGYVDVYVDTKMNSTTASASTSYAALGLALHF